MGVSDLEKFSKKVAPIDFAGIPERMVLRIGMRGFMGASHRKTTWFLCFLRAFQWGADKGLECVDLWAPCYRKSTWLC
jgi:hypothetical protein